MYGSIPRFCISISTTSNQQLSVLSIQRQCRYPLLRCFWQSQCLDCGQVELWSVARSAPAVTQCQDETTQPQLLLFLRSVAFHLCVGEIYLVWWRPPAACISAPIVRVCGCLYLQKIGSRLVPGTELWSSPPPDQATQQSINRGLNEGLLLLMAFSWLKVPTSISRFKTLLRPRSYSLIKTLLGQCPEFSIISICASYMKPI